MKQCRHIRTASRVTGGKPGSYFQQKRGHLRSRAQTGLRTNKPHIHRLWGLFRRVHSIWLSGAGYLISDAPSAAIYYLDTTGPTYTRSCASVMWCYIRKAPFLHYLQEETCDLRLPPRWNWHCSSSGLWRFVIFWNDTTFQDLFDPFLMGGIGYPETSYHSYNIPAVS